MPAFPLFFRLCIASLCVTLLVSLTTITHRTELNYVIQYVTRNGLESFRSKPVRSNLSIVAGANFQGYVSLLPKRGARTGNQIFQLAALIHVSRKTNRRIVFHRKSPVTLVDKYFDLSPSSRLEKSKVCPCHTVKECCGSMSFDPSFSQQRNNDSTFSNATTLYIDGYFQSWKYVHGFEGQLRQMLRWRPSIEHEVDKFW